MHVDDEFVRNILEHVDGNIEIDFDTCNTVITKIIALEEDGSLINMVTTVLECPGMSWKFFFVLESPGMSWNSNEISKVSWNVLEFFYSNKSDFVLLKRANDLKKLCKITYFTNNKKSEIKKLHSYLIFFSESGNVSGDEHFRWGEAFSV